MSAAFTAFAWFIAGVLVAAGTWALFGRSREDELEADNTFLRERLAVLQAERAKAGAMVALPKSMPFAVLPPRRVRPAKGKYVQGVTQPRARNGRWIKTRN